MNVIFESNRKVALYGGAFNPPHNGHLAVVEGVLNSGVVDELWMSPCNKHSFGKNLVSNDHRIEMCKLILRDTANAHVSTFEIDNDLPGDTYTCLQELKKAHPEGYEFYFIIGMDNAIKIEKFNRWQEVIQMISFIVIPRKGYEKPETSPHIFLDNLNVDEISSSMIREWLRKPKLEDYMEWFEAMDKEVLLYTKKHGLYKEEVEVAEEKKGMTIVATEDLVKTQFLDLMATEFIGTNGKTGYWTWCHRPGNRQAVVIPAIVKNEGQPDRLVVTKEFRVPLNFVDGNPYEYGFPAGLVDGDEDPETTAKRELEEETGLTVKRVIRKSPFVYNTPGITDESIAMVYVEAEGEIDQTKNESAEEIETMLLDVDEIKALMADESIKIGAKAWLVFDRFVTHRDI